MMTLLDQLSGNQPPRTEHGVWASRDGRRALLLARTRASGSDTDGQQHAVGGDPLSAFRAAQASASTAAGAQLVMSGPGVFAVQARASIKSQVMRLSIISSVLIVALLLLVYRSVTALLLGLVPVVSGALAGIAAVALGFGVVQGVTLGFGVTLIGEGVDYSIYLFVQSTSNARLAALGVADDPPRHADFRLWLRGAAGVRFSGAGAARPVLTHGCVGGRPGDAVRAAGAAAARFQNSGI